VGLVLCIALLSTLSATANEDFVNENINRKISIANPHGVENIVTFKVSRKNAAAATYTVPLLPEDKAGRLAKASCSINNEIVRDLAAGKGDDSKIQVPLPATFTSGTIACQTIRVGRAARRPYPAEIKQLEKQRFLFESQTIRVRSPYPLQGEETTEIVLPRGKIDLLEEFPGVAVNGNRVTAGPYKASATTDDASQFFRVQYDASFPVPLARYIEREIEISHWGNVAVEEHFDVYNDGAKLLGEFSRLDHQGHNVPHAFQSLSAQLPADAYGVYYRDELGNVTTSNLWKPKNKKVTDLLLKLRFPLYGGWHIEWYHGYNVPLTSFVSKVQGTTDRYLVDCDLSHPIEILAEKLVIHLVLPPGATNVKVETPIKSRIAVDKMFRRYTYLDVPWTARNVLSLELHDVLGEPGSKSIDGRLRVYYTYSDIHILEKPLTVSATIFAALVTFMAYGRLSA